MWWQIGELMTDEKPPEPLLPQKETRFNHQLKKNAKEIENV
jgi:hypothetical protein